MKLITPSLLNSWQWYLEVEAEDKQEIERQKFISVLKREKTESTPAMIYGQEFEDNIRAIVGGEEIVCERNPEKYQEIILAIGLIVRGGTWQLPCRKQYKDFLLYGRMDVVKGGTIYDIKTTSRYDIGKFQKSAQHKLYLYCTGLERCEYLVAEVYHGIGEPSVKGYCRESYTDQDIEPIVDNFIAWLEFDKELKELYYKYWETRY